MSKPTTENWTAAKGVLKYLAGTVERRIIIGPMDTELEGYWTRTTLEALTHAAPTQVTCSS